MAKNFIYLTFIERQKHVYFIQNTSNEGIGTVEICQVGRYRHWCLCPFKDMQFSGGCLDEIRVFMKNPLKYKQKYPKQVIENEKLK